LGKSKIYREQRGSGPKNGVFVPPPPKLQKTRKQAGRGYKNANFVCNTRKTRKKTRKKYFIEHNFIKNLSIKNDIF
jgi:hypothetical protein